MPLQRRTRATDAITGGEHTGGGGAARGVRRVVRRWKRGGRPILAPAGALLLAGCFPTLHTARVDPGLHLDAGVAYVSDQERNGEPQGPDYIAYVGPSLGIGDRVELGLPVGIYLEEGFASLGSDALERFGTSPRSLLVVPYAKIALLPSESEDHLAAVVQGIFPPLFNAGLRYGRDLGSWEPHVGASVVFSGGPAGDDPFITRYQEAGQFLMTFAAGASWNTPGRPAVEVGILLNHYDEGAVYGDFGQPTTPRTLIDLYIGGRVRLFGK